jgi:putative peptide zinc metalloprotease protein
MLDDVLTASTSRILPFRLRPDLQFQEQQYQGQTCWVVKDPLRSKYYRFNAAEFCLLNALQSGVTLQTLQHKFEQDFAPRKISVNEIHRLLAQAHRQGLLLGEQAGQGNILLEREQTLTQQRFWQSISNLWCYRLRGFNPTSLLDALLPWLGGLFSRRAWIASLCVGSLSLLLLFSQWETFVTKLPESATFFGPANWFWLAATLSSVKICHELAHALACRRLGGECRELGVMFFCGTPCLYCDVSDAWMIPDKWQRAAIGAAGMVIELWLASVATWIWWYSPPGLVQQLALNVMFIGSVGTLLFNANPLLRCDGYYILSDLWEIPNLRQRAQRALAHFWSRWLWGEKSTASQHPAESSSWLLLYAHAAGLYQLSITIAIVWFFYYLTEPLGYKIVGQLLALAMLSGSAFYGLRQLANAWKQARWDTTWPWQRFVLRSGVLLAVATVILVVPLPYYIRCSLRIEPRDAAGLYVDVPGEIAAIHARPGEFVAAGQPLMQLRNLNYELARQHLEQRRAQDQIRLHALRQQALLSEELLTPVAQLEQSLRATEDELAQLQHQMAKLTISTPKSGQIWPTVRRHHSLVQRDQLPNWRGHPLEARNLGAQLQVSECVALVGDPQTWFAILAVDQEVIEEIQTGCEVDFYLTQRPSQRIRTHIQSLSRKELQSTESLLNQHEGGEMLTRMDRSGRETTLSVHYEALAEFHDDSGNLAVQGSGIARIHAGYRSLGSRLLRALQRMIHWDL